MRFAHDITDLNLAVDLLLFCQSRQTRVFATDYFIMLGANPIRIKRAIAFLVDQGLLLAKGDRLAAIRMRSAS